MSIILPVGISFYTFQTLSYTIDVYRERIKPTTNFIQFAVYVAFFPQLVAGPIERAEHLLPQFNRLHKFDFDLAKSGISLIIWGLFKKIVVADNCGYFVDQIFMGATNYSATELWMGAILFGFQIYGDFSGYSDIAIGVARMFGYRLMTNFRFPYFSRNIAEFWRRWHISLSSWFRDYLYIPLGGSRVNRAKQIRNVFIVFLVSGLWHGANWTFIIWGGIHAILFLPLLVMNRNRKYLDVNNLNPLHIFSMMITFIMVTITWVFFRTDNINGAINYVSGMFSGNAGSFSLFIYSSKMILLSGIIGISIIIMLFFEFIAFKNDQKEVFLTSFSSIFILLVTLFLGVFKNPADFIYFQF